MSSAGRPELPGVDVRLLRCVGLEVCDAAHARSVQSTTTDDRGAYRFFGLAGGSYFVAVDAKLGGGSSRPIAVSSADEIRLANTRLAAGATANANAPLPVTAEPRGITSLVTYFPGTTEAERAAAVQIDDGEERAGVNITTQTGTAAKISGTVVRPDGQPGEVPLAVFPNQRTLASLSTGVRSPSSGTFVTGSLPLGAYRIAGRMGSDWWIAESFVVNGQDITNVTLQLRPTLEVSGRVMVDQSPGSSTPDLAGVSVSLRRVDLPVPVSTLDINTAATDPGGAFVIRGVMPGRYAVTCSVPNRPGATWWVKSAVVEGHDVLDSSVEVGAGPVPPALTITLASRSAEIAGVVRDAGGHPAPDYTVIAFPVDPKLWVTGSRRVLTGTVAIDGSFLLKGVPAGEYLVGLLGTNNLDDVDRSVLTELSNVSVRTTIAEGESKRIDLQVGARF